MIAIYCQTTGLSATIVSGLWDTNAPARSNPSKNICEYEFSLRQANAAGSRMRKQELGHFGGIYFESKDRFMTNFCHIHGLSYMGFDTCINKG